MGEWKAFLFGNLIIGVNADGKIWLELLRNTSGIKGGYQNAQHRKDRRRKQRGE